ncbi:hypothetical protein [Halorarius litoreus]|uniref:hypothetical protein n=1 Tax=Halorarius litoreus TaxID=2962676 RepID=UPI0020CBBDA5|nr:hypothetical protein [Halorarius litoreus]
MASRTSTPGAVTSRYPVGTGWLAGFTAGLFVGIAAWLVSGEVTVGLVLFVATGTALGVAVEQTLDGRALTPRERRIVRLALVAGIVAGAATVGYILLFA